jgi:uncharacterized protein (UPF0261 family)
MEQPPAIAVVGTFDSKGDEHLFLKARIEERGIPVLTINVGTKIAPTFAPDIDLYPRIIRTTNEGPGNRDQAIRSALQQGKSLVRELYEGGKILGIISAGGGTGTHLGTGIMRVLPLGVPKVMVSTVASRNMANTVGTKDIAMMHSVVDILGVNSVSGMILDKAAGAVCGMVKSKWHPKEEKRRVALTFFGFITPAAEHIKLCLEGMGYEVIPFHANGTGGMAMEELAVEGYFQGILDLATHEFADDLLDGYCGGIGPKRLEPVLDREIPRLVVPGGMDCAVLEFTRDNIPGPFRDRKIFFYDFRSAIRLNMDETRFLASQMAEKLNKGRRNNKVLIPMGGWSEADRMNGPLYDPVISEAFIKRLSQDLNDEIEVREANLHINDPAFGRLASEIMDEMVQKKPGKGR